MIGKMLTKWYRFIKYCITGLFNTTISYLVFFLLIKYLYVHYIISNLTAYAVGIIVSFIINSTWVFKSAEKKFIALPKFVIVNIINIVISTSIIIVFIENYNLNPLVIQPIAIIITLFLGFFLNKKWVFK